MNGRGQFLHYRGLGTGAKLVTLRLENAGRGLRGALDVVLGG